MKLHQWALGALTLVALAGCEQATSTSTSSAVTKPSDAVDLTFGTTKTLVATETSSTPVFYKLQDGELVETSVTESQDWVVALSLSSQGIFTNSGTTSTLYTSNGQGGVQYTGTKVFANATWYSPSAFTKAWAVDTDAAVNSATNILRLNVMTKLAYDSGDGSTTSPYSSKLNASSTGLIDSDGDGNADVYQNSDAYYDYYAEDGLRASGRVYIIRGGDGTTLLKFQVSSMSAITDATTHSATSRTRTIQYAVSN
jgi:hypothetical protein